MCKGETNSVSAGVRDRREQGDAQRDPPYSPVMKKMTTMMMMPSTGPLKDDRNKTPVWYSSQVVR